MNGVEHIDRVAGLYPTKISSFIEDENKLK